METPKDAGTKLCSNGPGHMTKMAATPFKNFLPQNQKANDPGTLHVALGCGAYQVCSNDDP